jgi:hypothetical protein
MAADRVGSKSHFRRKSRDSRVFPWALMPRDLVRRGGASYPAICSQELTVPSRPAIYRLCSRHVLHNPESWMQSDSSDATPLAILLNRSRCTRGRHHRAQCADSAAKLLGFGVPESQCNSVARGKAAGPPISIKLHACRRIRKLRRPPSAPLCIEAVYQSSSYPAHKGRRAAGR